MYKLFYIIRFLVLLFWVSVSSQELPPFFGFKPSEYRAENQNWSIAQGQNKIIYVANNEGLLSYNGSQWKLYPSPNETILRSVKVINEKIYTGAFMDFGYWEPNEKGDLIYTSIVHKENLTLIEDEQIWNILSHNGWVLFQSLHSIYIYNPKNKDLKSISTGSFILKSFIINEKGIYFQSLENGMFEVLNGKPVLISEHEIFKKEPVVNLFSSETNEDEIFVLTRNNGFFIWNTSLNTVKKQNILKNQNFNNITIYNSARLKNGDFVIGTISNGLIVIDKNGLFLYHLNQQNGLLNNTILSIFEDLDNNIWLGLDNGINCINHASPIKIFNDNKGILGTVYTSVLQEGNLYLGTNQGLFVKKYEDKKEDFRFVAGTEGQVWNLQYLKGTLFCGHTNGTFVVKGEKAEKISSVDGAWLFRGLKHSKNEILQGNYDGLYILKKQENKWFVSHKIEGFDISSRYFEVFEDSIFVNHEYKGVYTLKVDKDFRKVENITINGDLKGKNSSLITYKHNLLYAYKNGVFMYDFKAKKFEKDSIYSKLYSENNFRTGKLIRTENKDRLWSFSTEDFVYLTPGKISEKPEITSFSMPKALEKSMSGFENLLYLKDDNYLFGNSSGYYVFSSKLETEQKFELLLNSIKVSDKNGSVKKVEKDKNLELPFKFNSVSFDFSVPQYSLFKNVLYQYKLVGYNEKWSNWFGKTSVNFENLEAGEYKLYIRARIDGEIIDSSIEKNIKINKVWYYSNTAIACYVLFFGFLLFFLNNYYQSYYEKQKEKTLANIKNELALKELENNKQLIELENQKLIQDIENKNKELAISTMSLVKKNEFLNNIKKELLAKKEHSDVKDVIKIIDKNINTTNDWEFFQKAFDNADKDFLQKIKSKHSSLTPNDLKLCAYLRLNLSSKEIAPLLNISPRSVEVKRYRLRKKMELDHGVSLTSYILDI